MESGGSLRMDRNGYSGKANALGAAGCSCSRPAFHVICCAVIHLAKPVVEAAGASIDGVEYRLL